MKLKKGQVPLTKALAVESKEYHCESLFSSYFQKTTLSYYIGRRQRNDGRTIRKVGRNWSF